MSQEAFSPIGDSASIAMTTSSGNVALPGDTSVAATVRIHNSATAPCGVKFGKDSSVTAAMTDFVIGAGGTEVVSIPPDITHYAAILSTGTGTVYAQRGGGL